MANQNDFCAHTPHLPHLYQPGNPRVLQNMLSDLPSSDAFSQYDPSYVSDAFPLYLPLPTPPDQIIQSEKTRCLIRALTSKADRERRSHTQRREKRRASDMGSDAMPGVAKRMRWTNLDKERKQACVRVALSAACQHAKHGDLVYNMRETWLKNPRKKQMVNVDVRKALVKSVDLWTEQQLRTYLERAGGLGVVTVEGMVRAVRDHLAPELAPESHT